MIKNAAEKLQTSHCQNSNPCREFMQHMQLIAFTSFFTF